MSSFIGSSREINTSPATPAQLRTTLFKLLQSLNEDAASIVTLDELTAILLAAHEQTSLADEQIELGQVVRITSTGVALARANDIATSDVAGVAKESAASGDPIKWAPFGVVHQDGWGLTPGDLYYLSAATAGLLTTTAPASDQTGSVVVPVGRALTADDLLVDIESSVLL